jgi:hypothetical protein
MPQPPSPTNDNAQGEPSEPGRPGPGAFRPPRRRGAAALIACTAAAAVVWLALLPQLAELPRVRAMIARNESLGIDPSAKFYSELPAMPRLVDQVRSARRRGAQSCANPQ